MDVSKRSYTSKYIEDSDFPNKLMMAIQHYCEPQFAPKGVLTMLKFIENEVKDQLDNIPLAPLTDIDLANLLSGVVQTKQFMGSPEDNPYTIGDMLMDAVIIPASKETDIVRGEDDSIQFRKESITVLTFCIKSVYEGSISLQYTTNAFYITKFLTDKRYTLNETSKQYYENMLKRKLSCPQTRSDMSNFNDAQIKEITDKCLPPL